MDGRDHLAPVALQHLDTLYTLARWLVRDLLEAEALVEETYLWAIQGAHPCPPGMPLRTWLVQLLWTTFSTDSTEFTERAGESDEDLAVRDRPSLSSGDHRPTESPVGLAGLDLAAALDRLPTEERIVVFLADIEDCTMEEIATAMECPVATVKSQFSRARRTLKGMLGTTGP